MDVRLCYSSPPLAIRVSGRVELVLGVDLKNGRSEWVRCASSLLSGGYLGSMAAQSMVPFDELAAKGCPFDSLPGGLVPIAHYDARLLAAGMYTWSLRRGLLGDGTGHIPGLGALEPPRGNLLEWEREMKSLFFVQQLELADAVAATLASTIDPGWEGRMNRDDLPVIVSFVCTTEAPLTLASEIDRFPLEFVHDPKIKGYAFHPRETDGGILSGYGKKCGAMKIEGQSIHAFALSTIDGAILAARLEEITSSPLELEDVLWTTPEELDELLLD